jgi:hypothetical protein
MIAMIWNCRGLGDPQIVQELNCLVCKHRPQLVFLSENRQNKAIIENLRWRLGLKHFVSFLEHGKGGGLALFWHESVDVNLFRINNRIIFEGIHAITKSNDVKGKFCAYKLDLAKAYDRVD